MLVVAVGVIAFALLIAASVGWSRLMAKLYPKKRE